MKTILITGANKGIGLEIARQIGSRGWHVILSGRDAGRLSEALRKIQSEGFTAEILVMDISSEEQIRNAYNELVGKNIRLDVLINNAAILQRVDQSILDTNFSILETTIQTNVYGSLHVVRYFLPLMNRPGRIINVSSEGGSMTDPVGGWSPAYCVSKSSLNAITRHLAYELSGERITVNAVCPGWVRTDMGGESATRPVERGAETPVWLADEAPQHLTGKFFRDKKEIPW